MRFLSLLAILVVFAGCGNSERDSAERAAEEMATAAQERAYQTMMDGHDRVMPMMGQVNQLQKTILARLEAGGIPEEQRELLQAGYEQLEDAGDGMMEWMQQVKPLDDLRDEMSQDGIRDWTREMTSDIATVETQLNSSIASAEKLLGLAGSHGHDHGDGHDHDHDH